MRRILLKTIAFRATAIWIIALALALSARTIHVAKTGNDANAGDASTPYLTINKAAAVAQAGDSIIVHAGEYREWVQPARGGSSESARITYKAAPGEIVQIKGSERVTGWVSQGNGVWKVDLGDSFFNGYNPFSYDVQGKYPGEGSQYIGSGAAWCHLGEVYLDGKVYIEKQTLAAVQSAANSWYTSRAGTTSSIYANFGTANPNTQLAEVNAREGVFGNAGVTSGINYVTVDGFRLSQSADAWCPCYRGTPLVSFAVIFPTGTNWTIKNCIIKFGKTRGISCDGANNDKNHIIRDNVITECGIATIAGNYNHGTIVSGNWISDICNNRPYWGDEHGACKSNQSGNMLICGNVMRNVISPGFANAIYIDYTYTGNRVSGNLFVGNGNDVAFGAPQSSPIALVDNNIFIGGGGVVDGWAGIVNAHNLYFIGGGGASARSINNLVLSSSTGGLTYSADTAAKTITVNFPVSSTMATTNYPLVTTASIGTVNNKQFLNRDGSALSLDRDILNVCRNPNAKAGPFQDLVAGANQFVFRPNSKLIDKVPCTGTVGVQPRKDCAPAPLQPRCIRTDAGLRIELNVPASGAAIRRIVDMHGRTVRALSGAGAENGRMFLDFSAAVSPQHAFGSGLYMCEVRMPDGVRRIPVMLVNR